MIGEMIGWVDDIFGSDKKTTKTTSTKTTGSTEKDSRAKYNQFLDKDVMLRLLSGLEGELESFSAERGTEEAKLAGENALVSIMEQYLPQLQSASAQSGMYDSTTSTQLQGDLASRAMRASQEAESKARLEYSDQFAQLTDQMNKIASTDTGEFEFNDKVFDELVQTSSKTKESTESLFENIFGGIASEFGEIGGQILDGAVGGVTGSIDGIMKGDAQAVLSGGINTGMENSFKQFGEGKTVTKKKKKKEDARLAAEATRAAALAEQERYDNLYTIV